MQIRTFRRGFAAFKCKFEPFEGDLQHSNVNLNLSNGILSIPMQILTIRKVFKHLNANSNHSKGIRSIQMQILTIRKRFEAFKCKFYPFERDSKH